MIRFTSTLLAIMAVALASGCDREANPKVASTGLSIALDLQVDHGAIGDHFDELKERISLEKGKLKFKELRGEDVDTKAWCFMKYTIGESDWGIVPNTQRDCTDEDDDDGKKRAKRRAKRWLNEQTEAQEIRSEIDYLITDGWYDRALKAASQTAVSGFDFSACVDDAVSVESELAYRLADDRCSALMDNEELDVVALLGERGLERLGVDLHNVDDEDLEKAMKKFLGKLGELKGADGAAFLMLINDGWGTSCFKRNYLDHSEASRATVIRKAADLCAEVSESAVGRK